jgi:hypothetical protein
MAAPWRIVGACQTYDAASKQILQVHFYDKPQRTPDKRPQAATMPLLVAINSAAPWRLHCGQSKKDTLKFRNDAANVLQTIFDHSIVTRVSF